MSGWAKCYCAGLGRECRNCFLYRTEPAFRDLFDGPKPATIASDPLPPGTHRTAYMAPPAEGTGTELEAIFKSLGIVPPPGCDCKRWIDRMNAWGPSGCRERWKEIVAHLEEAKAAWGIENLKEAIWKAVKSGLILQVRRLSPIAGVLDLAIRRAEAKYKANRP